MDALSTVLKLDADSLAWLVVLGLFVVAPAVAVAALVWRGTLARGELGCSALMVVAWSGYLFVVAEAAQRGAGLGAAMFGVAMGPMLTLLVLLREHFWNWSYRRANRRVEVANAPLWAAFRAAADLAPAPRPRRRGAVGAIRDRLAPLPALPLGAATVRLHREARTLRADGRRAMLPGAVLLAAALVFAVVAMQEATCAGPRCGGWPVASALGGVSVLCSWGLVRLLVLYLVLRPYVVVDERGIADMARHIGLGLVPWDAIDHVHPNPAAHGLELHLRRTTADLQGRSTGGIWPRVLGKSGKGRLFLSLDFTSAPASEVIVWLGRKCLAHGVDVFDGAQFILQAHRQRAG